MSVQRVTADAPLRRRCADAAGARRRRRHCAGGSVSVRPCNVRVGHAVVRTSTEIRRTVPALPSNSQHEGVVGIECGMYGGCTSHAQRNLFQERVFDEVIQSRPSGWKRLFRGRGNPAPAGVLRPPHGENHR